MVVEIRELTDSHGKPLFVVYANGELKGGFYHRYRAENLAKWLREEGG